MHDVVIAGGGPTGLMLAAELALGGVDTVIAERRTDRALDGSRAGGLLSRTLEVLDMRGVAERFVAEGRTHPVQGFAMLMLPIADYPTRHNHILGLWQGHIERILGDWVRELGVPVLRGREVTGFTQGDDGVDIALADGTALRAAYLVGCDGGRSTVRRTAGIAFEGSDASTSWLIAEAHIEDPPLGVRWDDAGMHAIGPADGGGNRIVITERGLPGNAPDIGALRAALTGVYGTDLGVREATWISRFTDMTRQAAEYRRGRVLLAGDAAHVHPPHGGQGLNTGVQDAVNLGWKLAQVVRGTSPEALLDTYHAERHPVGARVLHNTLAQVALSGGGDRHRALRELMGELLAMDEPRRRIAGMLSGLDIRYELGEGHPLLGRRMPDLDLRTGAGPVRMFTLLHGARPVLLNLGDDPGGNGPAPWPDRVRRVDARCDAVWELPVIGEVPAPPAVLIRPDGYVAWAGELSDPELTRALETWFGPGAPQS